MGTVRTSLLPTGVPGLDAVLGGGLATRHSLIVSGPPGSGKTILASQLAFSCAGRGVPVVIATVTSEPHSKFLDGIAGLSFFSKERLGKEIFIVSAYPWLKKGVKPARDIVLGSVRERKAGLLVVDGLNSIRALWQDDSNVRKFLSELGVGLATHDCLGVYTTEASLDQLMRLPEAATIDGVLSLASYLNGLRRQNRLEVVKLRGRGHLRGEHVYQLNEDGMRVFPRIEAVVRGEVGGRNTDGRAGFGIPAIDDLVHGGVPAGGLGLVAGPPGSGKTTLAKHFALAGGAEESVLFVSLREPEGAFAGPSQVLGERLAERISRGTLLYLHHPPTELEADELADEILTAVRVMKPARLVVDGASDFESAVTPATRGCTFFSALAWALRRERVTSFWTVESEDSWLAARAELVLLLRSLDRPGRARAFLKARKVQGHFTDRRECECEIGEAGFEMAPTLFDSERNRRVGLWENRPSVAGGRP